MDYDHEEYTSTPPTDSIVLNETEYDQYQNYEETIRIYHLIFYIFFVILSFLCITANISIFYLTIKFKRLREKKANIILLNICTVSAIFLSLTPFTLYYDFFVSHHYGVITCVINDIEFTLLLINILHTIFLALYWYVEFYHPVTSVKFARVYLFFPILFYVIGLYCLGLHVQACTKIGLSFSVLFVMLVFIMYVIFLLIFNIIHLIKRRKLSENERSLYNVPLLICNVYFLSKLPVLISMGFYFLEVHLFIVYFSILLAVVDPIYNLIILFQFDKDYRKFLKHILSGRWRTYVGDELGESPAIYSNNDNEVQDVFPTIN